jgi:hypothetical protein
MSIFTKYEEISPSMYEGPGEKEQFLSILNEYGIKNKMGKGQMSDWIFVPKEDWTKSLTLAINAFHPEKWDLVKDFDNTQDGKSYLDAIRYAKNDADRKRAQENYERARVGEIKRCIVMASAEKLIAEEKARQEAARLAAAEAQAEQELEESIEIS